MGSLSTFTPPFHGTQEEEKIHNEPESLSTKAVAKARKQLLTPKQPILNPKLKPQRMKSKPEARTPRRGEMDGTCCQDYQAICKDRPLGALYFAGSGGFSSSFFCRLLSIITPIRTSFRVLRSLLITCLLSPPTLQVIDPKTGLWSIILEYFSGVGPVTEREPL